MLYQVLRHLELHLKFSHSHPPIFRGKLEVSKNFDWFKEDFGVREQYFAKYAKWLAETPEGQKTVSDGKAPLSFLEYDWSLNDAKK